MRANERLDELPSTNLPISRSSESMSILNSCWSEVVTRETSAFDLAEVFLSTPISSMNTRFLTFGTDTAPSSVRNGDATTVIQARIRRERGIGRITAQFYGKECNVRNTVHDAPDSSVLSRGDF